MVDQPLRHSVRPRHGLSGRRPRVAASSLFLTAAFFSATANAFAPIEQDVLRSSGSFTFHIVFDAVPDFVTVDAYQRRANQFQYYIVGAPEFDSPFESDSIVRIEDDYFAQGLLVVRGGEGDGTTGNGGWGALRGTVPYTLDGHAITFSAPLSLLTDRQTTLISYRLETYEYGGMTSYVVGLVPEVPTALMLGAGGVLLTGWRRLQRRRH